MASEIKRRLRPFHKQRIANIMAAAVIFWTMCQWSFIIYTMTQGQQTVSAEIMAIVAMFSTIAGFAAKHLWDSLNSDENAIEFS